MQRQAVPTVKRKTASWYGMEGLVASDSGVSVIAENDGVVHYVDSQRIVHSTTTKDKKKNGESGVDIYNLTKYMRSMLIRVNQLPIVKAGMHVKQVIFS